MWNLSRAECAQLLPLDIGAQGTDVRCRDREGSETPERISQSEQSPMTRLSEMKFHMVNYEFTYPSRSLSRSFSYLTRIPLESPEPREVQLE